MNMAKPSFSLTYEQLLFDLHIAYFDARRHKRKRIYQIRFEADMERNLREFADELWHRTYKARPSTCFIISDPKKREVFAADFRDRIVHHLYYNYTHRLFERTFIHDSYSCIKGRGTHYGIARLRSHIRKESLNFTERCYILKMDISGYFMQINREKLLEISLRKLCSMRFHHINNKSSETWNEVLDFDFLTYLSKEIILLNPVENCRVRGSKSDWDLLPYNKSLFHSPIGCGLPIGNLTSQLFSNVYLGELDQFMKRTLHCRRYGRYVDDFYVVSSDKEWLCSIIPHVRRYLTEQLYLTVNDGKTQINDSFRGVEYLGAYVKPHRTYISRTSLNRIRRKLPKLNAIRSPFRMQSVVNSYLGIFSHYSAYRLKRQLFAVERLNHYGYFETGMKKYVPYSNMVFR